MEIWVILHTRGANSHHRPAAERAVSAGKLPPLLRGWYRPAGYRAAGAAVRQNIAQGRRSEAEPTPGLRSAVRAAAGTVNAEALRRETSARTVRSKAARE
jgi:hypothetical protein